jgi:hypothetical protein
MDAAMKECMKMIRNMDLVSTVGPMVDCTKETGLMVNSMAKENTFSKTVL